MIKNASDTPLDQSSSALPQMGGAIQSWLVPMVFIQIVKTVINHRVSEVETPLNFKGTWQPLSQGQLNLKPEGQRIWKWFNVHTTTDLKLKVDDKITYRGIEYRIMNDGEYSEYGYYNYHLVEGFQ